MSFALQRFANGDTNYISKHNSNAAAIEAQFASVATTLKNSFGAAYSFGTFLSLFFGPDIATIGAGSYTESRASTNQTIAAGYLWRPDLGLILHAASPTVLAFAGRAAATYYIHPDSVTGTPAIASSPTAGDLYSVVWSGSAFGTVTALLGVVAAPYAPT